MVRACLHKCTSRNGFTKEVLVKVVVQSTNILKAACLAQNVISCISRRHLTGRLWCDKQGRARVWGLVRIGVIILATCIECKRATLARIDSPFYRVCIIAETVVIKDLKKTKCVTVSKTSIKTLPLKEFGEHPCAVMYGHSSKPFS